MEPFSDENSEGVFKLWSSQEVCKYSGEVHDFYGELIDLPTKQINESDKILNFFIMFAGLKQKIRWAMVLPSTNNFIGAVGFNALGNSSEIAYHIHPDYWGHGYAIEACSQITNWATETYGSTSIEAFIEPKNIASIKLISKLNFKATGVISEGAEQYVFKSN